MIRVYFDSDVINKIHSGEFPELANFISENRNKLLIPYSQAHISDKLPSKEVNESLFWSDLDYITEFAQSKLVLYDSKKRYSVPYVVNAREVLKEIIEDSELIEEFSSIDNIISFMEKATEEAGAPSLGSDFKNCDLQELGVKKALVKLAYSHGEQIEGILVTYPLTWYIETLNNLGFEHIEIINANTTFVTFMAVNPV